MVKGINDDIYRHQSLILLVIPVYWLAQVQPIFFFKVVRNRSFLILLFASGFGIGSFSFLSSVVQQYICLKGKIKFITTFTVQQQVLYLLPIFPQMEFVDMHMPHGHIVNFP